MVDRLDYHAEIIFKGDSYRLKDKQKGGEHRRRHPLERAIFNRRKPRSFNRR